MTYCNSFDKIIFVPQLYLLLWYIYFILFYAATLCDTIIFMYFVLIS